MGTSTGLTCTDIPLVTWRGVLPIFQAGHEGSIPFARSTRKTQVRVMIVLSQAVVRTSA